MRHLSDIPTTRDLAGQSSSLFPDGSLHQCPDAAQLVEEGENEDGPKVVLISSTSRAGSASRSWASMPPAAPAPAEGSATWTLYEYETQVNAREVSADEALQLELIVRQRARASALRTNLEQCGELKSRRIFSILRRVRERAEASRSGRRERYPSFEQEQCS
jgi:hypothetical protein